jgi:hypothetical protein
LIDRETKTLPFTHQKSSRTGTGLKPDFFSPAGCRQTLLPEILAHVSCTLITGQGCGWPLFSFGSVIPVDGKHYPASLREISPGIWPEPQCLPLKNHYYALSLLRQTPP